MDPVPLAAVSLAEDKSNPPEPDSLPGVLPDSDEAAMQDKTESTLKHACVWATVFTRLAAVQISF